MNHLPISHHPCFGSHVDCDISLRTGRRPPSSSIHLPHPRQNDPSEIQTWPAVPACPSLVPAALSFQKPRDTPRWLMTGAQAAVSSTPPSSGRSHPMGACPGGPGSWGACPSPLLTVYPSLAGTPVPQLQVASAYRKTGHEQVLCKAL